MTFGEFYICAVITINLFWLLYISNICPTEVGARTSDGHYGTLVDELVRLKSSYDALSSRHGSARQEIDELRALLNKTVDGKMRAEKALREAQAAHDTILKRLEETKKELSEATQAPAGGVIRFVESRPGERQNLIDNCGRLSRANAELNDQLNKSQGAFQHLVGRYKRVKEQRDLVIAARRRDAEKRKKSPT